MTLVRGPMGIVMLALESFPWVEDVQRVEGTFDLLREENDVGFEL